MSGDKPCLLRSPLSERAHVNESQDIGENEIRIAADYGKDYAQGKTLYFRSSSMGKLSKNLEQTSPFGHLGMEECLGASSSSTKGLRYRSSASRVSGQRSGCNNIVRTLIICSLFLKPLSVKNLRTLKQMGAPFIRPFHISWKVSASRNLS